jgi:PAS domain-containing protein
VKVKIFLVFLIIGLSGFILTQATGQILASQLPARFFEEYGAVMLVIDPESGQIREANQAAAEFYGYSMNQLQGMKIQEINALDPEDVALERS